MTGVAVPAPARAEETGLTEEEAACRVATAPPRRGPRTSRSYASIVRANVLTVFNAILTAFGVVTLIFGGWRDALFLAIVVVNSAIGIRRRSARSEPSTGSLCWLRTIATTVLIVVGVYLVLALDATGRAGA